jgi:hypothetical protein
VNVPHNKKNSRREKKEIEHQELDHEFKDKEKGTNASNSMSSRRKKGGPE